MQQFLHIGGLIAAGFDPDVAYLLTISHSGRGLFSTRSWQRVARSVGLAYPIDGVGVGIGPIEGHAIAVTEMDFDTGRMSLVSPDGRIILECESDGIVVTVAEA
jgi:hypothetical protein